MKKGVVITICCLLFFINSGFVLHKFYVSIFQINFVPQKKMLQITSRIFIDDLNDVLFKKYKLKTHIGEVNENSNDLELMDTYIHENFKIKINGIFKTINYVQKERDGNVIVCYFNCKEISKIKVFEVQNTCLFDLNAEQQNIIHANLNETKQTLLLTSENFKGMLKVN